LPNIDPLKILFFYASPLLFSFTALPDVTLPLEVVSGMTFHWFHDCSTKLPNNVVPSRKGYEVSKLFFRICQLWKLLFLLL